MTIDDVMKHISHLKVRCWQAMQDNVTNDDKWHEYRGGYAILEEIAHYILLKTNPHNRSDIKKFNEKQEKKKIRTTLRKR